MPGHLHFSGVCTIHGVFPQLLIVELTMKSKMFLKGMGIHKPCHVQLLYILIPHPLPNFKHLLCCWLCALHIEPIIFTICFNMAHIWPHCTQCLLDLETTPAKYFRLLQAHYSGHRQCLPFLVHKRSHFKMVSQSTACYNYFHTEFWVWNL